MEEAAENDADETPLASPGPELYFLVAKLLSSGPMASVGQLLISELARCGILPRRLDWQGDSHRQSFQDLEWQYPAVSDNHLLSVCAALLRTPPGKPQKSLLCSTLFRENPPAKANNILDILNQRSLGRNVNGNTILRLPSAIYGSLQLQRRTLGHLSSVYCVLFDRTGRYIITGADDLLVKVWSAIDGRLMMTLRGASAEITDVAIDTNNSLLAVGSLDRLVRVWEMQTGAPVAVLQGHSGMITSVHFGPSPIADLHWLISTSTDGSVAFWMYSVGEKTTAFISKPVQFMERMRPGASQMICASWSPGGVFVAAGSADHHVRVYMITADGVPKRILETAAHSEAVDSLQWAHFGLKFVSGSKDGTAIMWQLHATQWRHTILTMSETLPNQPVSNEDSKKLKVTMVAWNCTDDYIITAVSDYTLKVWCTHTGKLLNILKGHKDEVYVLEAHPSHPSVLLSAGHDGQIFFWNIISGIVLNSFMNNIDGQGFGAVFDAKWSPDGTKVTATDSHGHLLILGLGKGHSLLENLPSELFFHTDYRPLAWDPMGGVCDEQTGIPPHLMPPPFLVDVEGNPHPPSLQKLVPGREHATFDQLVPEFGAGDMMLQEGEIPRSHISYMIEALAMRQVVFDDNENNRENNGNNIPNRSQQSRSNSNQQRNMENFNGALRSPERIYFEQGPHENRLGERRPSNNDSHLNARRSNESHHLDSSHTKRLFLCLPSSVLKTKRLLIDELHQMELSWYAREMRRRPVMINTSNGNVNEKRHHGRKSQNGPGQRKSRPPPRQDYDEPPEYISPQESDSSDSTVRLSLSGNSYNSSQTDVTDSDSRSSSSEYSDWVADQPGVPLEPPKRSKRKPAKQKKPVTKKTENDAANTKSSEIPEAYRPSEWLCAVLPRKAPYHPQMGDECMYFKQGHSKYLDAVIDKNVFKIDTRDKPWEKINLKECETVKVIGIKYVILPPRLVCLKLALENGNTFTVRYHDMPDVIDFFVLKQMYETAVERNWKPGDRFRCMIDDGWWMGAIVSEEKKNGTNTVKYPFLSLRVRWDNGEYEQMSPWDLEPIDESRIPQDVGGWVSVLSSELEKLLYQPRPEEWPGGDRDEACSMIAHGIDQVMGLAIAEPFIAPVDLNAYPMYAYIVEYPIDLSTIKSRFENHFYRRVTSAQFDVRYLATNAEKFNLPHTPIVKRARIITELCLKIIRDPFEVDVQSCYHSLMDSYNSSDSDTPLSKQVNKVKSLSRRTRNHVWYTKCRDLLKEIIKSEDSVPFRDPVPVDLLPEYLNIVSNPIDISLIKSRLESGSYKNPKEFGNDMRLIFKNSKLYNTNKRSEIYAMTIRLTHLFEDLFKPIVENWKRTRRKVTKDTSSDGSVSEFDDDNENLQNNRNHLNSSGSNNYRVSSLQNRNGRAHCSHRPNSSRNSSDSWDSDVPLTAGPSFKGKGKGKKSIVNGTDASPQKSTRSSGRINGDVKDNLSADGPSSNPNGHTSDTSNESSDNFNISKEIEEDSGDSYKPSKKMNGKSDPLYASWSDKKSKKKKKDKKQYKNKNMKSMKRKRQSEPNSSSNSSSDTSLSVASLKSKRRYESDHSFQLRFDSERNTSNSDSDDNRPLGSMRAQNSSLERNFVTVSRLRQRYLPNSDESLPGPSQSSSRSRRTVRDSKRPRYNEDSEEDSIAAISKRLRAHLRPCSDPVSFQSRSISNLMRPLRLQTPQINRNEPTTSNHSSHSQSSSSGTTSQPNGNVRPQENEEPISISSRGRIRKLTPKAKNLLRD